MTNAALNAVSVLGLGNMGAAIAKAFVNRGFRTTVWNRSQPKAAALAGTGVTLAPTPTDAVAASPIAVICLLDGGAVDEVLAALNGVVTGKVLVNVTSGGPEQARAHERWANKHGAQYIDGKILGDPAYVGTPQTIISFSGSRDAFAAHEPTLRALGAIDYHGEDAGAAAVEFMGQVAIGYEMLIGFLHTLRLIQAEGMDVEAFAGRVASSVGAYPTLLTLMAKAVKRREYAPDLGPLNVQAALMDDMISHRESLGVDVVRMREVKALMDRRIAEGHGDQGFSSLIELMGARR